MMTTTISGVKLVDLTGEQAPEFVDVEIGPTIQHIRAAGTTAPIGDVVDGTERFLLPGLIDTHVHLGGRDALVAAARAGVTTIVDLGTHPDSLVAAQRAERGVPTIISAGSAASAPGSTQIVQMGFPPDSGVARPADAERYLDWRTANGSDLIKIIIEDPAATDVPALEVATIIALVEGARRRGLRTVAHVITAAAFDRGLDAGVDILTHAPLDRPLDDRTVSRMADNRTVASPTLIMMRTMARARLGDRADTAFANALESVRRMHQAGVTIVTGTDANETPMAPVPHGSSMHDEIALLQQAGLTMVDALLAATVRAADSFRLDGRGVIAEGAHADLVLVDGDPSVDPAVLRRPAAVWIDGELVV
jgi:imidazolonepropionase-like amidohydrolase